VAILQSPHTVGHSPKVRLVVTMTELLTASALYLAPSAIRPLTSFCPREERKYSKKNSLADSVN
jgi:hypothetical protein